MGGPNPLAESPHRWREHDFVAINRSADLERIQLIRANKDIRKPGQIVVAVAGVVGPAGDRSAAIAKTHVVSDVQSVRRDRSLYQPADEVHRNELAPKPDHFGSGNR